MKLTPLLCRLALITPWALSVHAANITKDASGTDLTAGASWGGSAPGSTDTAVWSGGSLGSGLTLGSDASWGGVSVVGAASDIAISGAGILTLGAGGIDMSASSVNASISNAVALGANQSWAVGAGRTLTVSGVVSGTSSLTLGSTPAVLGTSTTFLTGTAQTILTNVSLASVLSASGKIAGGYVGPSGNGIIDGAGYFLSNNGSTATFWMEGLDGGYIKAVQVELTQSGADITARAVAAKYVSSSTLGFDFNTGGSSGTVATSQTSAGYGVHTTTLMSGVAAEGTTVLSAVNTYTGATNIVSGVVRVGVASQSGVGGALGNESAVTLANVFGATLDLNGFDTRIGSLAGGGSAGGNVTLGSGSLVVGGNNTSTVYSGVISGTGALIKVGTGTLDLGAENTYAGGTFVNEGVLRISDPNVNGVGGIRGDVTVTVGGTLLLSVSNALGWAGGSKVNNLNIQGGTVTTEVNADNGWGLAINMTGGSITAANGGYFSMGGGSTITSNASATSATIGAEIRIREGNTNNRLTFTVADGAASEDLIVSGQVTQAFGAREVWKAGAGALVFTGGSANSYTGLTTVAEGVLLLAKNDGVTAVAGDILVNGTGTLRTDYGKSGRIADGANVTVDGSGASFQLGANQNETINTLAVNNGATVNIGGTGSNLRPNGGITSSGSGTINGDSGNAGLNFNGGSRTVNVANANELLLVNVGIHNGALVKTGAGILLLIEGGDYSGGTTINGGRILAGHQDALGTGAIAVNAGGAMESSVADIRGGSLALSGGTLVLNAADAGTLTLGLNGNFVMSSGTWTVDLASGLDQIIGSGTAAFTITGGTLDLAGGLINYGQTYSLITGFTGANSVSGLTIQGYDSNSWTASLNSAGVLSFAAVPEPSAYGLIGAGLFGGISLIRRRRRSAPHL